MRPLLGTYVEVGARGSRPRLERAVEAAFECLQRAHARWSFHDPDSELTRFNRSGTQPLALHPQTLRLLRIAHALMLRSGGRFNCTVGGLLVRRGVLPDHGGDYIDVGEAGDLELGAAGARLRRPLRLTLDGIAKGYAVDLAVGTLKRQGARAGWVNAGGDLRVFGDLALPVHRREPDGRMQALGILREAAVATSQRKAGGLGDDRCPGCIVAPPDLRAADAAGVWTVLARSAWRADALTKVAANAGDAADRAVASLGGRLVTPAVPGGPAS
ncbi:FAD:protein FMN transferase [Caldimonas brevitalea]|nr:FAD:protein FMN transferase [Caldimonas brevitalea]